MTYVPIPPGGPVPGQFDYSNAPRRTNGVAIASLVLGILGCVPLLTGILAIVLGCVGIRRSRRPDTGGYGLAVAGLVLGIVSVVTWSFIGAAAGYGYVESQPARGVARQFLKDLDSGNVTAALNESSGFTATQLQDQVRQMNKLGSLRSVTFNSYNISLVNARTTVQLEGDANFNSGTERCVFTLIKQGSAYKVTAFRVY